MVFCWVGKMASSFPAHAGIVPYLSISLILHPNKVPDDISYGGGILTGGDQEIARIPALLSGEDRLAWKKRRGVCEIRRFSLYCCCF